MLKTDASRQGETIYTDIVMSMEVSSVVILYIMNKSDRWVLPLTRHRNAAYHASRTYTQCRKHKYWRAHEPPQYDEIHTLMIDELNHFYLLGMIFIPLLVYVQYQVHNIDVDARRSC